EAGEIGRQSLEKQQRALEEQHNSVEAQIVQGKESTLLQQQSVNAQLQTMYSDERPYLTVTAGSWLMFYESSEGPMISLDTNPLHGDPDTPLGLALTVQLTFVGKTPALNIRVHY